VGLNIDQTADGVEATDMQRFAAPWARINANVRPFRQLGEM